MLFVAVVDGSALLVATLTALLTLIAVCFRTTNVPIVAMLKAESIVLVMRTPTAPCVTADYHLVAAHGLVLLPPTPSHCLGIGVKFCDILLRETQLGLQVSSLVSHLKKQFISEPVAGRQSFTYPYILS